VKAVEPFGVRVDEAVLDDLKHRLQRTRWPGEVAGSGWARGAPLGLVQTLADYWREQFDRRRVEARINALGQFRARVDGTLIHFVHERGRGPRPLPLLVSHGYEASRAPLVFGEGQRVTVPCAVARFPREEPMPPRSWVERGYDVQRWTEPPRGGHFAAMEQPELLARDIRDFFRPVREGSTT
jgi:pimeloyl-ACP methyl ester carboxylesterase